MHQRKHVSSVTKPNQKVTNNILINSTDFPMTYRYFSWNKPYLLLIAKEHVEYETGPPVRQQFPMNS